MSRSAALYKLSGDRVAQWHNLSADVTLERLDVHQITCFPLHRVLKDARPLRSVDKLFQSDDEEHVNLQLIVFENLKFRGYFASAAFVPYILLPEFCTTVNGLDGRLLFRSVLQSLVKQLQPDAENDKFSEHLVRLFREDLADDADIDLIEFVDLDNFDQPQVSTFFAQLSIDIGPRDLLSIVTVKRSGNCFLLVEFTRTSTSVHARQRGDDPTRRSTSACLRRSVA